MQIDDKNKTRGDLIRTSLKIGSTDVFKLLSDFLCKISYRNISIFFI
jgi:hypothetical protein